MLTLLAFIFVLGVLVFVHEAGHFLMARYHGVRVLTFSLGFGPNLVKWVRGGTEYCVKIIPLGGFVKMAGETVDDNRSGEPDEFLSKSKWVRFQVYVAGPIMNILLAYVLTTGVLLKGADVPLWESSAPTIGQIAADSPAAKAGLRVGDTILSIGGTPVKTWDDLSMKVLPKANQSLAITVDRDGAAFATTITPASQTKYELGDIGVGPKLRPQVALVNPGSPADKAGLKPGDVFLGVDGQNGLSQPKLIEYIRAHAGQPVAFALERAGQPLSMTVTPADSGGGIGQIGAQIQGLETRRIDPTFVQALSMGASQTWQQGTEILNTLKGLFTRETPVKQLMGPVAIAELSGSAASLGWLPLLGFMSMISLNLGLLNLLPIPVLDGGHIAILAMEGAARRDFSLKVKERILFAGFALIVMMMGTAIFNDIARLFR